MTTFVYIFTKGEWNMKLACHGYGKSGVKTVSAWMNETGAELVYNLGLFNMKTKQSCTYIRTPAGLHSSGGASDIVVIAPGYECRGYANAIKNNTVCKRTKDWLGGSSLRNGVGRTTDGDIIIARTSGAVSEARFASDVLSAVKKRGKSVELFVFEDGGGSVSECSSVSGLSYYPKEVRAVSSVITATRIKHPCVTRPLFNGRRGADVAYLQILLTACDADGIYGGKTAKRVSDFQRKAGFKGRDIDGRCGPMTQKAMGI